MPQDVFDGDVVVIAGESNAATALVQAFGAYGCKVMRLRPTTAGTSAVGQVTADLIEPESIRTAFDRIVEAVGTPTVLVNAGHCAIQRSLLDTGLAEWRHAMGAEFDSSFFTATEFARRRVAAGKTGAILDVVVGTVDPQRPGHRDAAAGGVENQVRCLALEWARDGIRVNALACGCTDAALAELRLARELGWAAIYLCSPYAAYVTGQTLRVHAAA